MVAETKCQIGARGYSLCCCNCKHKVFVIDHESNNALGFGCTAFLLDERMVYCGGFEHGLCELHEPCEDAYHRQAFVGACVYPDKRR